MKKPKIVMIDDDPFFLKAYQKTFKEEYDIFTAQESVSGLKLIEDKRPALLLLDVSIKTEKEGLQILPFIKEKFPLMPIIIVTNHDSHTIYREAIATGADDFFVKSNELKTLRIILQTILAKQENKQPNTLGFIAESDPMKKVVQQAAKAAAAYSPVVISGETGTGKEIIARFIHHSGPRHDKPFVVLNCGALTETLIEDEFFGHEKGAYTGALFRKKGCFERAHGGILFLDELEDLSPKGQASLLRVLQEMEIQRIGGSETISVDVRVLCALKGSLLQLVKKRQFREDLYYRLAVFEIKLFPLNKRQDDILPLFYHFLEKEEKKVNRVTRDTLLMLQSYPWPGNVRELENSVKRSCAMLDGNVLRKKDFSFLLQDEKKDLLPYDVAKLVALNNFRRNYVREAMIRNKGNQTLASKETGLSRQALQKILKDLKIDGGS